MLGSRIFAIAFVLSCRCDDYRRTAADIAARDNFDSQCAKCHGASGR